MKAKRFFLLWAIALFCTTSLFANRVEINGEKKLVLEAKTWNVKGKLSTGEMVRTTCSGGACHIVVEYKGRNTYLAIGDDIDLVKLYEYDFDKDGDMELLVVNDFMSTTMVFVYSYAKGMSEKLFEYEPKFYRFVIDGAYIHAYVSDRNEKSWHFYNGMFFELRAVRFD